MKIKHFLIKLKTLRRITSIKKVLLIILILSNTISELIKQITLSQAADRSKTVRYYYKKKYHQTYFNLIKKHYN